jgi:hypothetical protein
MAVITLTVMYLIYDGSDHVQDGLWVSLHVNKATSRNIFDSDAFIHV